MTKKRGLLFKLKAGQTAGSTSQPRNELTAARANVRTSGVPVEAAMEAAASMPRLLKPEQVAAALGVSERTLERWRSTCDGPPYLSLTRKTVPYTQEAIAAFLGERVKENTAQ
jgi:predicted DNA-binding transcriptional regulator AlpA